MSYQTILQPDGKLAVWSTVVDDFVAQDLLPGAVVEFYLEADRRACETNKAFAWAKLSPERREEEARKFMAEAAEGLREMVADVAAGRPREGDWSWAEAIEIVGACHGKDAAGDRQRIEKGGGE